MGVHLWPACVENFSKVSERWCSHAGPEKRFEKKIWLCFAGVGLLLPLLGLKRPRSSAKNTAGGRLLLAKKGRALGFREIAHIFCQVFQCMINVCMVRLAEQQFHAKKMLFLLLSFPIYGHKEISTKSFFWLTVDCAWFAWDKWHF